MTANTIVIIGALRKNLALLVLSANENTDCKGFVIIFGNYSINVPNDDKVEFWELLDEIEEENEFGVTFHVDDYDDLCLTTDQFVDED
jgi:hypothetical protein